MIRAGVGCAAGFHHHLGAGLERIDEALELPAREALPVDHSAGPIRDRHLEDLLLRGVTHSSRP